MMMNLFSTFDPSTGLLSLNWLSTLMITVITPKQIWTKKNKIIMINYKIMYSMYIEMKNLSKNKSMLIIMITTFNFILINNLMGLLPYIYTASAQMLFSLSLSLPMWIAIMLFMWIKKTKYTLAHLVPLNTPTILLPFMVIIETISNMMRPGSLAVRLTANMITGHLIMSLLGSNHKTTEFLMMLFMMLMMFETAVSIIQAYVFTTLMTLYSSEYE